VASVFGSQKDSDGSVPRGLKINAQYYNSLLFSNVQQMMWKKRPGRLSEQIILLHENISPHMADLKVTLGQQ
jgi:hypothetical protein